jgi:hypothetical protein
MSEVERMFHETKAENRLTGEWFNLTPAQVGAALDRFMAATKELIVRGRQD